jgi:hypothetical protein
LCRDNAEVFLRQYASNLVEMAAICVLSRLMGQSCKQYEIRVGPVPVVGLSTENRPGSRLNNIYTSSTYLTENMTLLCSLRGSTAHISNIKQVIPVVMNELQNVKQLVISLKVINRF